MHVENEKAASKMDEDGTYTLTRREWGRASQISRPLRNVEKAASEAEMVRCSSYVLISWKVGFRPVLLPVVA